MRSVQCKVRERSKQNEIRETGNAPKLLGLIDRVIHRQSRISGRDDDTRIRRGSNGTSGGFETSGEERVESLATVSSPPISYGREQ